jgi:hypothetical protein
VSDELEKIEISPIGSPDGNNKKGPDAIIKKDVKKGKGSPVIKGRGKKGGSPVIKGKGKKLRRGRSFEGRMKYEV